MATPVYPPTTTTNLLINTRTAPKIVYLPAASTIAGGKLYFVKDICGNCGNSSIFLSTTGLDTFENRFRPSTLYTLMSTNFQAMLLASDGMLNWMILQNYNANVISRATRGFSPRSITGLSLWFDPSDITTLYQNSSLTTPISADGQTVSGMADKSGNGYYATSTNGPTYKASIVNNQSILRFNGSQWINNVSYPFPNTAYSVFAIGYLTSYFGGGGGWQRLLQAYADGIFFLGTYTSIVATFTGVGGWNGGVAANNPSYNWLGSWYLVEMQLTGSTLYPYVTGNAQTTKGSSTTAAFTNLNIGGANGAYSGQPWYGDIGEIIVYNSYLSDTNRQTVEGYLAWKWGLQSQLPAGHPYKNAPP